MNPKKELVVYDPLIGFSPMAKLLTVRLMKAVEADLADLCDSVIQVAKTRNDVEPICGTVVEDLKNGRPK